MPDPRLEGSHAPTPVTAARLAPEMRDSVGVQTRLFLGFLLRVTVERNEFSEFCLGRGGVCGLKAAPDRFRGANRFWLGVAVLC